jgi:transposase
MPPVRRRAHYQHVTQFERGRIIGMRVVGLSYRAITHRVRRNVATVLRCCRAWFEEGRHQRVRGTGPRRRTTDRQDRHLRFLALRDRFSTTREVANAWYRAVERPIVMSSIYRRRSFKDLMGRRLTNLHSPPLTLAAFRHEIQVAWDSVPQDEINHLIGSMPRCVHECIGSRGGPTHY